MATKSSSPMVDKHLKALKAAGGKKVEAGWFESDRYPTGMQVARIARINEWGATIIPKGAMKGPKGSELHGPRRPIVIPARPFMRKAAEDFKAQRAAVQMRIAKRVIDGKITQTQALGQLGEFMAGLIAKSIKNGGWQKNAPATIKSKGFDSPLRDTGHMFKTVNSKVS